MSWALGYDSGNQRDIGYGVPSVCEHPDCTKVIDRGMGHACGGGLPEDGCGRYFCYRHGGGSTCQACGKGEAPFPLKPDHPDWLRHKLQDASWADWRAANSGAVVQLQAALDAQGDNNPSSSCGYTGAHFGAHYPDAICIDGHLWDLDSCDVPGGPLYSGGDMACPCCNTREYAAAALRYPGGNAKQRRRYLRLAIKAVRQWAGTPKGTQ